MKFKGLIKEGKFLPATPEKYDKYLTFKLEGKGVDLDIKEHKITRTLTQNAFYWLYLGVISDETGHDANELHEIFKRRFLPPRYVSVLGKEYKLPASTSKLDKSEMSEYMMRISAETDVPIPNPEDVGFYK